MNRGDIYYITIPYSTGKEMAKARPGIIVTCDEHLEKGGVVQVVYCTTSEQLDDTYHVEVHTGPHVVANALCEHIYTVDRSRISTYIGHATDEEMDKINHKLAGLITDGRLRLPSVELSRSDDSNELAAAKAELAVYKELYGKLLSAVLER